MRVSSRRRGLSASSTNPHARVIHRSGVEFRVAAGEADEFWDWYESPSWEPETLAVFALFARPGARIADIGAWLGPTALLAAALGAEVVAVEPDPVSAELLRANLALNAEFEGRVSVVEAALAANDGTATLVSAAEGGDSLSHLASVKHEDGSSWQVRALSVQSFLELPEVTAGIDLVKIDAEAAEYAVVPSLARSFEGRDRRPSLYIATHPNLLYDRRNVARRVRSGFRALLANRRMLGALSTYRHHYVWADGALRDRRRVNVLRALVPLPIRASFLVGACLFTDRPLS